MRGLLARDRKLPICEQFIGGFKTEVQHLKPSKVPRCSTLLDSTLNSSPKTA